MEYERNREKDLEVNKESAEEAERREAENEDVPLLM